MTLRCPYCGYDKPSTEFTDEHVLPRALGGNLEPTNPFLIRVCRTCNTACGRWIDGRFVRSNFIASARALAFDRVFRRDPPQAFPLVHGGRLSDWVGDDGTVCEFWLGPTGDRIFHFHAPYDNELVFAGRPPHIPPSKLDLGRVFVGVVATNPAWHPLIAASVRAAFGEGTPTHFINAAPVGKDPPHPPVPASAIRQFEWVLADRRRDGYPVQVAVDTDFGERFLMKCALGMGTRYLGEAFCQSQNAADLRGSLWARTLDSRYAFKIRGQTFFDDHNERFIKPFQYKRFHVIALIPSGKSLALVLNLFGSHFGVIQVSDDPNSWATVVPPEGLMWIVHPAAGKYVGPFDLLQLADLSAPEEVRASLQTLEELGEPLPPRTKEAALGDSG